MGRRYDVLTALDVCADCIITGDDLTPEYGQAEKLIGGYTLEMGGSNCIFACQSAKLGLRTAGVGVAGQDLFGELCLKTLDAAGVNIEGVTVDPGIKTGLGIAFCADRDRAMLTYLGTLDPPGLETAIMPLTAQCRHLHIGSYFLMNRLRPFWPQIAAEAKRHGATVSLDPNWDPEGKWDGGLRELLPYVDVLFPNENEAMAIAGGRTGEEAAAKLCGIVDIVALKMGERGATAFVKGVSPVFAPPTEVDTVDAIGAGDSFDAGFLAGYLAGRSPGECLRWGGVCGGMSTRSSGGIRGQVTGRELTGQLEYTEKRKNENAYSIYRQSIDG